MKKSLKWRLSSLPTPDEVRELVKDKLITKDEAREILFSQVDEVQERDKKSLESEVKFLRSIIEKLAPNTSKIIETIRIVEKPYVNTPWYQSYQIYCSNAGNLTTQGVANGLNGTLTTSAGSANTAYMSGQNTTLSGGTGFSNIKTF